MVTLTVEQQTSNLHKIEMQTLYPVQFEVRLNIWNLQGKICENCRK